MAFESGATYLLKGSEKLIAAENLRVPLLHDFILSTRFGSAIFDDCSLKWQNGCDIPGAVLDVVNAKVVHVADITARNAIVVKKLKRELQIELDDTCSKSRHVLDEYDAGDSVYFIFPNLDEEVSIVLERLNLNDVADTSLEICIDERKAKSFASLFPYIPDSCSCRYLLKYCLDIRRSPGRPLLRALSEFCADKFEQRRLLELCSTQGTSEFTAFVRQAGLSFTDVLLAFPSCRPPIGCLIELLPRLLPRAYSISNYKSDWKNRLRFVYSLLRTPASNGVQFSRYGVCSGWLNNLKPGDSVQIALKEPSKFRLPPILKPKLEITKCPLILVGPGTGIAPFMSFLQKIKQLMIEKETIRPRRYLLYGSSDLSEEFLFKDELTQLQKDGVLTDLILCESRPSHAGGDGANSFLPKYVYEALKARGSEISELLANENTEFPALLYSCGDVKNMSKELWTCLGDICMEHLGQSRVEAFDFLQRLRVNERLIEDVWS